VSQLRRLSIPALFLSMLASAQPIDLISNERKENPSRYGLAATSFDLNGSAVARGSDELQLRLPDGPMTILRRKAFQSRDNNSGAWRGSANLRNDSDVLLTLRNGYMAGTIQVGTDTYEIRPQGNRHVVEKLNLAAFEKCRGTAEARDTAGSSVPISAPAGDLANVSVDLLSVYTPQARAAAGGSAQMEAIIQSAVDMANLSFSNSLVNTAYRLVRTAEVAHNDAGDLNLDLSWVRADATVAALRNAAGADLVSLIVENGAGYCGMGFVMHGVSSSFASSAFQVTARSCAVGNLSFAHEHGHNIGMEHDPTNGSAPTSASYPWSFGHLANGVFRTVMSYATECPSGCARVPYFSNPSVAYSGYPAGVAYQRDNARTARLTTPVAAAFRAEAATTPPAAPSSLCVNPMSSSQLNLTRVDNSATESGFLIERSTDGVTFSQIALTSAGVGSFSNTGLTAATTYTYRVRATNAVGNSDPTDDATGTTLTPTPPAAPQSLAAVSVSGTQINLIWLDKSTNETGFRIERSVNGSTFTLITTLAATATSYSNTSLASNTTYTYRVSA
jgi:hypothetical protein